MAVRRESVVLDLDDRLTPGLIRAAAAAGVLDRELNKLNGQSVRTSRSLSLSEAEVKKLGNTAGGSSREIDRFSGRVGLLADAVISLGPAAVTMTAVAVPAVAALGGDVVALGLGVGTTKLAFHGLGTALTAFNKAAAAPTATNIAAAQAAMDKIPPSAQRFVLELHRLNPEMKKLQESAGEGLFKGLTSGIKAANEDLPLARRLLSGVSTELGTLADQAGHSLASSQWRPFLKFASREAPIALDQMGHALGSVTHGVAGLWMAFAPMNNDIGQGIVNLADDFDKWANSLGKTKGFQDFLAYVDANGPRVLDTLGQMGITLVDIGTAAAPIGGPVLDVLKSLFEVIDAIANSDFGTPLMAGLIAFRLYARAAAMMGAEVEMSFRGVAQAPATVGAGLTALQAKTTSWARSTVADISAVRAEYARLGGSRSAVLSLMSNTSGAAQRTNSRLTTLGKGAAAAGGIALVASGAASAMGATNTASLALMGTLAGPWGAAVGGAVGLLMDMNGAAKSAAAGQQSLERVAASSTSTWAQYAQAIGQAKSAASSLPFNGPDSTINPKGLDATKAVLSHPVFAVSDTVHGMFGQSLTDQANEGAKAAEHLDESFSVAFTDMAKQWNSSFLAPKGGFTPSLLNDTQIGAIAQRAQPAMDALGISLQDLTTAYDAGDGSLEKLVGRITTWTNQADTAAGKSRAVARAFASMSDDSMTAEDRIKALTDSLDSLIDPMLNVGAAHDQFHRDLNDLDKQLAKNNKTLKGNSDAAIQNRTAVRGLVSDVKNQVEAQANAGASAKKMSATLREGRRAIIEQGQAAGLNRQQIQHMIDTIGLTPKLVKTLFQSNAAQAAREANSVQAALNGIDRVVDVHINVTRSTNALLADVDTPKHADGGFVSGPGGPRDDRVPAWLSNGEFVVNAAATARNLPLLHSINAQKFAGGGKVGGDDRMHSLERALSALQKAIEKDQQSRDRLIQIRQQTASTVSSNFRSDFLGVDAGPWMAAQDPASILRGDIRSARQYRNKLRDLKHRGLRGALAGQITTLAQAQQVDSMSNHDLHQLERLFRIRQQVSGRAGMDAGNLQVGAQISHTNAHLARLNSQVHTLNAEVKHLRHEQKQNAKHTGDAVGDKINDSAGKSRRRARTH